jgi:hypothetical protein
MMSRICLACTFSSHVRSADEVILGYWGKALGLCTGMRHFDV